VYSPWLIVVLGLERDSHTDVKESSESSKVQISGSNRAYIPSCRRIHRRNIDHWLADRYWIWSCNED